MKELKESLSLIIDCLGYIERSIGYLETDISGKEVFRVEGEDVKSKTRELRRSTNALVDICNSL